MAKRSLPRHKRSASDVQRKKPRSVKIGERQYELVDGCLHVEGHRLTRRQIEHFKEAVAYRESIAQRPNSGIRHAPDYAYTVGLSDVLWKYRPTAKAQGRIHELAFKGLVQTAMAMTNLDEYSFAQGGVVTEGGCALLRRLADEAETHLSRIRHFVQSMETEGSTKLQDWIKREEEFNRLRGAQS